MKRTPFIILTICIGGVSPLASAQAKLQCWAEPPPDPESHWSYRIIDDRKCWYEGKPMLSRSLLEWPPQTSKAAAADNKSTSPSTEEADGFEARWRDRFLNAMGKY
jgi:hypothetical protein